MAVPAPVAVLPRRWTVATLALSAAALSLAHAGLWSLLVSVALVTLVLVPEARRRRRFLVDVAAWLPVGAMVLLAGVIVVVVILGFAGVQLWSPDVAPFTWATSVLLVGAVGFWRGGHVALVAWPSAVAWLPALVLVAAQVYRHAQPMSYWSRPIWTGTDWMNHADMVIDLRVRGLLDYRLPTPNSGDVPDIYPRGLHALLAWIAQVSGAPTSGADTWESTLWVLSVVMAALAVLAVAGACLMAVVLAMRITSQITSRTWIIAAAPLVTGVIFVHPTAYGMLFEPGFATTAATVVALFALVLVANAGPTRRGFSLRLALSGLLTAAVFNLWQLMALPFVLTVGLLAAKWWRAGHRHGWIVVAGLTATVVACLPLGLRTFTGAAVQHAATAGGFSPFPTIVSVVLCVVPVIVFAWALRGRRVPTVAVVLGVSLVSTLALGLGLLVYTGSTWDDVSYYPAKVLWHATLLAIPAAVVAAGYLLQRAWSAQRFVERGPLSRALRVLLIAAPVVLLVAYFGGEAWTPWSSSLGRLASAEGQSPQVPMVVVEQPELLGTQRQPAIIWKLHPQGWQFWALFEDVHATQIARSLGHPVPPLIDVVGHSVPAACAWLKANPDAVRITGPRHGEDDLLAGGCPESVVRPDAWTVAVTPSSWWMDTRWESTGGAMDPTLGELGDARSLAAPAQMSIG